MSNVTISTNNKTKKFGSFKKAALAVAITSIALTGCLDSGGSSSDKKDEVVKQVSISGLAVKGLLSNATVTAYTMSRVKLGETTTAADGTYSLPQTNHQGAILIELTTNTETRTVCDAAPGCGTKNGVAVGFGDDYAFNDPNFILTSVLPNPARAANQQLMVTPLTHLAAQRVVKEGLSDASDIQGTINATAKLLGLVGVDINTLAPVDITNPQAVQSASNEAKIYGALVGAIATMAEEDTNASVADVIKNLTDDFTEDGGLKANSTTPGTISLNTIFKKAGEVVVAANTKAATDEVEIELGATGSTLLREEESADNKPADEEVTPPATPVTPGETTDADKLAVLLEDVALWDNAIEDASAMSIYQPFNDQLDAAGELADTLSEQSALINTIEGLVANEVEINECYYYGQNPETNATECMGYDHYTETANGPLLEASQIITKSLDLVGFYERHVRLNGTAGISEYSLSAALGLGYIGEYDHVADDVTITIVPTFDGNNRMTSTTVDVTHSEASGAASNVLYSVSRDEGAANSSKLTYSITNVDGHFGADTGGASDIDLSGTGGEVEITLANNSALQAFIGVTEGTDAETLMNVKGLEFSLNLAVATGSADGVADTETATFDVTGSFTHAVGQTSSADLVIEVNASNTVSNETAVGTITLETEGTITETVTQAANALSPVELMHEYIANSAGMSFEGSINLAGENNTSTSFDGNITSSATALDPDALGRQEADKITMEFDGAVIITDAEGYITNFTGEAKVTTEALKNADGSAFYLGEDLQQEATSMNLTGNLSTQTSAGNASVNVEAAITFDYSDLILPSIALPEEDDEVGAVTFSFKDAVYSDLYNDGSSQLSSVTLMVDTSASLSAYAASLNAALPGLDAVVYGSTTTDYVIEIRDCNTSYCSVYIDNNHTSEVYIGGIKPANALLSAISSADAQLYQQSYRFNPHADISTTFGEIGIARSTYWGFYSDENLVEFTNLDPVTKPMFVMYSDYQIDYDVIETADHYRKVSASLKIDTALAGIEDGHVTLTVENVATDDFKASALFSYGPRVLKLDLDTREATNANKSFVTIENADISLKLVATCATETDDQGMQDTDIIAACEGDLDFSGDIYINGSDEKVAVIEDRDGLQVIKFVAGDSYGVVMVPNLDFVKQ